MESISVLKRKLSGVQLTVYCLFRVAETGIVPVSQRVVAIQIDEKDEQYYDKTDIKAVHKDTWFDIQFKHVSNSGERRGSTQLMMKLLREKLRKCTEILNTMNVVSRN